MGFTCPSPISSLFHLKQGCLYHSPLYKQMAWLERGNLRPRKKGLAKAKCPKVHQKNSYPRMLFMRRGPTGMGNASS